MKFNPFDQTLLYGLDKFFIEMKSLSDANILPNKILLSGFKGIGKCTLAIHLINYILSKNEDFKYDVENFTINKENKSYKLIQNKSSPNFYHIDIRNEKKNIDINQIRELIEFCNKSSFNDKPRFILIDNIEFLNLNSSNALLKILEEPNNNIYFILINSGKFILPTVKSRCVNFKINLSYNESIFVINKIIGNDIFSKINKDLINYYFTPGNFLKLYNFSNENKIDISELDLDNFLIKIIEGNFYKKDSSIKDLVYDFIQMLYLRRVKLNQNFEDYMSYIKLVNDAKIFNLDNENLYTKLRMKLMHE